MIGDIVALRDIMAFLRARYDEDERVARAATAGPWRYDPAKHWRKPGTSWFEEAVFAGPAGADAVCVAGTGETDDPQSMADAEHIARHHPIRVLAEVDAKRRLLDDLDRLLDNPADLPSGALPAMVQVVRLLALRYADHPDYRETWRP